MIWPSSEYMALVYTTWFIVFPYFGGWLSSSAGLDWAVYFSSHPNVHECTCILLVSSWDHRASLSTCGLPSLKRLDQFFKQWQHHSKRRGSDAQLFYPPSASHLLIMFHWPEQVSWLRLMSSRRGYSPKAWTCEVWFIQGINVTTHPNFGAKLPAFSNKGFLEGGFLQNLFI